MKYTFYKNSFIRTLGSFSKFKNNPRLSIRINCQIFN